MKTIYIVLLAHFVSLLCCTTAYTQDAMQDTSRLWRIQTIDGNEYVGKIISKDGEELVLQDNNIGTITLNMQRIRLMREADPKRVVRGHYWSENPQSTRYFFAPNGYGLRKGEGYYQNVWIFLNQASVGLTDQISIGVGMVPAFLFFGAPTPVWITPKISFPIKKDVFNLGVGALAGTVVGEDTGVFGIGYGVATLGNRDKNLTFGLGYGFIDGEFSSQGLVTVGGMLRTGKKGYLMLESYFAADGGVLLLGGRTVWSRISLDYGGIVPLLGYGQFVIGPWLGIAIPLGK